MLREFALLFGCTLIAYIYQATRQTNNSINEQGIVKNRETVISVLLFIALSVILVCHSGLRTTMNDTWNYIRAFANVPSGMSEGLSKIDWSFGANPGFYLYRVFLKSYVSESGYVFIFISALIPVILDILYIKKHAEQFALGTYLFIAFCAYGFTMVAIKQSIATAIGLWAVDFLLEKKYVRGALAMILAMSFHPYVVIFAILPFLSSMVWKWKTTLIVIGTAIAGMMFSTFAGFVTEVASDAFGDNYNASEIFEDGTGLKLVRFFVYVAIPILSFVYKKEIQALDNKYVNICVNASIISACFVFVGLFGGGMMLGRMANFLDMFVCLSGCYVIKYGIPDENNKKLIMYCMITCFAIYFYTYNHKYCSTWMGDMYNHISLPELIKGW